MQTFIKKHINIILLIISCIIFYTIISYFNEKRVNTRINTIKNGVYSIAEINEFGTETRNDFYKYSFFFKDNFFKSRCNCGGRSSSLIVNQKYFIIIDPENPNYNNFLLYRYPVPDSITEAPSEGWKELPIPVDKEEIRKFLENY